MDTKSSSEIITAGLIFPIFQKRLSPSNRCPNPITS